MYCGIMGGCTLGRKVPFVTTSFKKGEWAYFEGGPVFSDYIEQVDFITAKNVWLKQFMRKLVPFH